MPGQAFALIYHRWYYYIEGLYNSVVAHAYKHNRGRVKLCRKFHAVSVFGRQLCRAKTNNIEVDIWAQAEQLCREDSSDLVLGSGTTTDNCAFRIRVVYGLISGHFQSAKLIGRWTQIFKMTAFF